MYIFIRNICFFVMKLVKINESQHKRLFEAYRNGFSLDNLAIIADSAFADENNSAAQINYCKKWLGEPDSRGSSRMVFTLSDSLVLKLAYGDNYQAGIEQNKIEYMVYQQMNTPLLPRIFYHDKKFTFLICEHVVPAKDIDFEQLLGLPFFENYKQQSRDIKSMSSKHGGDYEIGFDQYFDNIKPIGEKNIKTNVNLIMYYIESNYALDEHLFDVNIEQAIARTPWLEELKELVRKTKMTDLCKPNNFGMVNRDGKPMLVILDSGFNMEVWNKFYR